MKPAEITVVNLAFGRIFRVMSRPERPGDIAEYERCRAIILDLCDPAQPDYAPSYARDRLLGSAP